MPKGSGKPKSTAGGTPSVPTLALRGGLSGVFVDFDLLPDLLADLGQRPGDRGDVIPRWTALLEASGFDARAIDPDEHRVPQPAATLAAEGAWRLAERLGFTIGGDLADAGREVAGFAALPPSRRREPLAPALAPRVEAALHGQNGQPIIPLLCRAAHDLAASTNLWVRTCPGLTPVEVGAIVYWACVDARRAESIVQDIEINRDVSMHRLGAPDLNAPMAANAERHFHRVLEFYVEQPELGERVPLSFAEEVALARLLGHCGLLRERAVGEEMSWLAVSLPGAAESPGG